MAVKRFRSSLFGFNKKDVNKYIENIFKDVDEKLAGKDIEISRLTAQFKDISSKYEILKQKEASIIQEKERISQAFIIANEASLKIIEEAKVQARKDIEELENYAEKEREKIVDIKKELKYLKESAKNILARYEESISGIVTEEAAAKKVSDGF